MRSNLSTAALVVCSLLPTPSAHSLAKDIELYVAPSGKDTAAGTQEQPLASMAGAQQRVRELRASDAALSATVWFQQGVYELKEPVTFTVDDNAEQDGTTTYSALPDHQVILRGGVTLTSWDSMSDDQLPKSLPTIARRHIRVVDLGALGIDELAPHPRRSRHALMQPTSIELFQGDRRLPAARWPNQGWAHVPAHTQGARTWMIDHQLHGLSQVTSAWAHGFWHHDWQDSCEPITLTPYKSADHALPSELHQLTIEHDHSTPIRAGARFRIEHLLSELDAPGEWFVDHDQHLLYVWPIHDEATHPTNQSLSSPSSLQSYFVSTVETPISCYDCQRTTFRGLTIEGARATCVEVVGGQQVTLDNCVIRHAGNLGVSIYHGFEHCITGCQILSTGAGAIRVEGGDRETLTPAAHTIEHNHLHDYCQLQWCYRPAVNVYGVGVTVQNNEIDNAPHAAIILHGNEHQILKNHIHHVCTETDDVGAIYLGHNPTYRGNVISENYIHDLGDFSPTGVIGIYLDDFASGTQVTGNLLRRAGRGVAIGGGRDNLVEGNLFIDCLAAVQIDNRGTNWAKHFVEGEQSQYHRNVLELASSWELYTTRYPELAQLMTDSPAVAKGNRIRDNRYESRIGIDIQPGLDAALVVSENNRNDTRQFLVDVKERDFLESKRVGPQWKRTPVLVRHSATER